MKPTNSLQLIHGGRFKVAHDALRRNRLRARVVHDRRDRKDGLQAIAKRHKVGYNEVLDLMEEQLEAEKRAARLQGFEDGIRSARSTGRMPGMRLAA